jgi:hypothetical protein
LEIVVGFLIAWAVRKARRIADRADGLVDTVLDANVDRLARVVVDKLGGDAAVERLQVEAAEVGDVSPRTRTRVGLALEHAAEEDVEFAEQLRTVLAEAQQAQAGVAGAGGMTVSGGVHAAHSGVAIGGVTGGAVSVNQAAPDPHRPERT